MKIDHTIFKQLPKVDLHRHLDGSLRVETIYNLAKEQNYKLPTDSIEELKNYVQVPENCNSLGEFLKKFETFYALLEKPEAMERVAYEVSEDAYNDNVTYCEFRFAPVLQAKGGHSMEEILDAVLRGLEKAHNEFDIINPLILCCYRSESAESSLETVNLALKYRDRGIVGVDLAGDEEHFPAEIHKEAFDLAKKENLNITVHAGEVGPPSNMKEAIEILHSNRIGHGIRLPEDRELLDFFVEKQIPLEVCPTSNVHTNAVKSYSEHPLKNLINAGVNVTINTDDPGVSNITLSDEYNLLIEKFNLDFKTIKKIMFNGINSSFTTNERKTKLKENLEQKLNELNLQEE